MITKYIIRPVLIRLITNGAALYGVVYFLPDRLEITGGLAAYLIASVVLAVLNILLKPILKLLSLPFIFLTLGLFTVFINGFIFYIATVLLEMLTSENISVQVSGGVLTYVLIALVFGILNYLITILLTKK